MVPGVAGATVITFPCAGLSHSLDGGCSSGAGDMDVGSIISSPGVGFAVRGCDADVGRLLERGNLTDFASKAVMGSDKRAICRNRGRGHACFSFENTNNAKINCGTLLSGSPFRGGRTAIGHGLLGNCPTVSMARRNCAATRGLGDGNFDSSSVTT